MKKITVYILSLLLLSSICSCLDDKNNYDYTPINELKGTISNIEKNYSVGIDEDLVITPTFEFTIDKTDPDVSYEWRLDGELLNVKAPSYTFNSHKIGLFELTFSVIDNKTGVKYSASTDILVRSPYQRGWVVLSDVDGKSTLSFIKIKTLYGVSETVNIWGEKVVRDSIAYHSVEKYLVKDLGTNPKGVFEHLGYPSTFGQVETVYDELVVMQDRWVELNGNTLEREVYTEDEFYGDLPVGGFKPVEAAMSYSAKFIRDENGYIYMHTKPVANDFHAGAYMSIPLWNYTKFSALYPVQKFKDRNMDAVLALREEDNSLVIIRNGGGVKNSSNDPTFYDNTVKDTGEIQKVAMKDDTAKGKVILNKTDKSSGEPLKGVEFELRDSKGKVLETLKTDAAGHAESKLYEIATFKNGKYDTAIKYYLVETKTLDGYTLDQTKHEVTFAYADDSTPVVEVTFNLTNEKPEVPETPNTPDTPQSHEETKVSNAPKTGDSTNIWLPILLLVISTGGMAGLYISRKRK